MYIRDNKGLKPAIPHNKGLSDGLPTMKHRRKTRTAVEREAPQLTAAWYSYLKDMSIHDLDIYKNSEEIVRRLR